ncbi:hypothetical protein E4U52_000248 [Claviceps spartinae]|nr:hypothetical protein E4U52_000248 [Claviceps spartinae]
MTSHSIDDDELHLMYPKIKTHLEKYVSRSWFDSNDSDTNFVRVDIVPLSNGTFATHNATAKSIGEPFGLPSRLNERKESSFRWDGKLESGSYAPAGRYRFVTGSWKTRYRGRSYTESSEEGSIWNRVHKEVVMIFRKVLSDNGVLVDENLIEGEDDTADPSEEDYAVNLPELPSVDRTDVGSPLDETSSDSNKKEEKLPEEPASALPECVHFEEKQASVPSQENPTADLDDKPCVTLSASPWGDVQI